LFPEVGSVALNTSDPERVAEFVGLVHSDGIPRAFWAALRTEGMISVQA
jgi:hypothetical protein